MLDSCFTFRLFGRAWSADGNIGMGGIGYVGRGVFAFKLGVIDRYDTPLRWRRYQHDRVQRRAAGEQYWRGRARAVVGVYNASTAAVAGDVFYTDLFWTLDKPLNFVLLCAWWTIKVWNGATRTSWTRLSVATVFRPLRRNGLSARMLMIGTRSRSCRARLRELIGWWCCHSILIRWSHYLSVPGSSRRAIILVRPWVS